MSDSQSTSETIILATKVLGGNDAVEFSQRIHALATSGIRAVDVDMINVDAMNSSGLGMLVAAHSTMLRFGGVLRFKNVPQKVHDLLRMTHLDSVFHYADADTR